MDELNRKATAKGNISFLDTGVHGTKQSEVLFPLECFRESVVVMDKSGHVGKTEGIQLGAIRTSADYKGAFKYN